jgi:hypothetical protein
MNRSYIVVALAFVVATPALGQHTNYNASRSGYYQRSQAAPNHIQPNPTIWNRNASATAIGRPTVTMSAPTGIGRADSIVKQPQSDPFIRNNSTIGRDGFIGTKFD